jgi:hypothetical protein
VVATGASDRVVATEDVYTMDLLSWLQILLMIEDKTTVLNDLLSLAGYLMDQLVHHTEDKSSKLAMLAQTSPTLLEWMRKQVSWLASSLA